MPVFGAAARATLVRMRCPRCGTVQARARGKQRYECRKCHEPFTASKGKTSDADPGRSKSSSRK